MTHHADNESRPVPSIPEKIASGNTLANFSNANDASLTGLRELLEKNLKWSQIIYEQNRKIRRSLLLTSIAAWVRTFIVVVPILIALWFLPAAYTNFRNKYGSLFGLSNQVSQVNASSTKIDDILKTLPINDAQREEIRNMFK